jgi:hypothetical protein
MFMESHVTMNDSRTVNPKTSPAPLFLPNLSGAIKRASIQFGCLSFAILLLTAVAPLGAQITGGSIQGVVTDATGSALPGAQVTVTNSQTGVTTTVQSNNTGLYVFPTLIPGTYELKATATGFKSYSNVGIPLAIQQTERVDVTMAIGAVTETVEVRGTTQLETETTTSSTSISGTLVENLPLLGRNPLLANRLIAGGNSTLAAGSFARPVDAFGPTDIMINGTPTSSQEYFLDGVSDVYGAGAAGFLPPTYAVDDVRVQTFSNSAEFGQTGGAVTTVETKSGGNKYHGTVWYYHHDQGLDANSYFNNHFHTPKTSRHDNQFGATIGGPISIPRLYSGKDRTFFFFDFELTRNITYSTGLETVPTLLERGGDFSQTFASNGQLIQIYDPYSLHTDPVSGQMVRTQFLNNKIPSSMINSVAQNMINNVLPLPNLPGTVSNYYDNGAWPFTSSSYHFRIDHHISAKDWLFGSYGFIDDIEHYPALLPSAVTGYINDHRDFFFALGYVHSFNSNRTLDVRAGVHRDHQNLPPLTSDQYLGKLNLPSSLTSIAVKQVFPIFSAPGISGTVGVDLAGNSFITPDYRASITQILGRHSLKFGYEGRIYRTFAFTLSGEMGSFTFSPLWSRGPSPNVASATAGVDIADVLLGTPTSGFINTNASNASQSIYNAVYLQDNWRLTKRLVLNLGLRWDMQTPTTERFNRANHGFDFTTTSPINAAVNANLAAHPVSGVSNLNLVGGLLFAGSGGQPRQAYQSFNANFMPRVGAVYQLDSKTVVRGGYGIFYPQFTLYANNTVSQAQLPLTQLGYSNSTSMNVSAPSGLPQDTLANPFPNGQIAPVGSSLGLSTLLGQSITVDDTTDRRPRVQQFQVGFERQFASDFVFNLTYAGSRSDRMPVTQNVDPIPIAYATNPALSPGGIFPQVTNPFKGVITVGSLSGATVSLPQLLTPFPQFTAVNIANRPIGRLWYNALQAGVTKRASYGLTFLANYTWSKTMTQNAFLDPYHPLVNDISPVDRPQILIIGGLWEVPVGRNRHFGHDLSRPLDFAVGGWNLSWIASFENGFPTGPWSGAVQTKAPGSVSQNLAKWFDTSAFSPLPPFTLPTVRPYLSNIRAKGTQNYDFTIAKVFPIKDSVNFEVGLNLYNAMNHAVFSAPNISVTSAAFGTITGQANTPRWLMIHGALSF